MHQHQRRRLIEETLGGGTALVTVEELAEKLAASPATIRRDITALARAGRLRRVRGGAAPLPAARPRGLEAPAFEQARRVHHARKRAIAAHAARLCAPGESIIVNGGTTTYCMGEFIAGRELHVLTNSFALASYLASEGNCRVLLPGGEIQRAQSIVLSPYERDTMIDHFYARRMFTSALAIRPQGLIEGDPILIKAEQKLIDRAEELIVLADGSKFGPRGSLILCPLRRIGRVITDDSAPPEALAMLRDAGVPVEVVEVPPGNGGTPPD
ncbi:DeoR/GlpR family DNA-binding transcription regulator [Benzoatithermus flavus]|uniref:DeoR/GlpR family DNA-binding transcription regulator n=1 Tax=Benzoatithermus flavus TaxID=3108223 RepID=A0ABU8XPE6_9PROT